MNASKAIGLAKEITELQRDLLKLVERRLETDADIHDRFCILMRQYEECMAIVQKILDEK